MFYYASSIIQAALWNYDLIKFVFDITTTTITNASLQLCMFYYVSSIIQAVLCLQNHSLVVSFHLVLARKTVEAVQVKSH